MQAPHRSNLSFSKVDRGLPQTLQMGDNTHLKEVRHSGQIEVEPSRFPEPQKRQTSGMSAEETELVIRDNTLRHTKIYSNKNALPYFKMHMTLLPI